MQRKRYVQKAIIVFLLALLAAAVWFVSYMSFAKKRWIDNCGFACFVGGTLIEKRLPLDPGTIETAMKSYFQNNPELFKHTLDAYGTPVLINVSAIEYPEHTLFKKIKVVMTRAGSDKIQGTADDMTDTFIFDNYWPPEKVGQE